MFYWKALTNLQKWICWGRCPKSEAAGRGGVDKRCVLGCPLVCSRDQNRNGSCAWRNSSGVVLSRSIERETDMTEEQRGVLFVRCGLVKSTTDRQTDRHRHKHPAATVQCSVHQTLPFNVLFVTVRTSWVRTTVNGLVSFLIWDLNEMCLREHVNCSKRNHSAEECFHTLF